MQIKDATYISYEGKLAREVWYEGTLVWQTSSFGWTLSNLPQGTWTDIEYCNNGTIVAVGNNRYSYSVNNGTTWGTVTNPINPDTGTEAYHALCCGPNHMWVILEERTYAPYGSGKVYTTFNPATGLATYTLSDPVSTAKYTDLLYSSYHGKYVAIGDKVTRYTSNLVGAYSTDGVNWLSAGYLNTSNQVVFHNSGYSGGITEGTYMPNNRLVCCGVGGGFKFGYSNDGMTWKQGLYSASTSPLGQNLLTGHAWSDVTYGYDGAASLPLSGRYVAVNSSGATVEFQFAYSDDGIGWYGVSYPDGSNLKQNWSSVVYGNGYFVALGSNGYQAMSKDGVSWSVYQNLPLNEAFFDVCVANNRFVALVYNSTGGGAAYANFIF